MVFMVNILITKPNGIDLVLDQMMGWTDGGAQTPFIPFSLAAKLFRKAELKSLFNLNNSLHILFCLRFLYDRPRSPGQSMGKTWVIQKRNDSRKWNTKNRFRKWDSKLNVRKNKLTILSQKVKSQKYLGSWPINYCKNVLDLFMVHFHCSFSFQVRRFLRFTILNFLKNNPPNKLFWDLFKNLEQNYFETFLRLYAQNEGLNTSRRFEIKLYHLCQIRWEWFRFGQAILRDSLVEYN